MSAVIGGSILDYIEGGESAPNFVGKDESDEPIESVDSLLESLHSSSTGEPKRLLLKGPPKSGKTSLAMNFAYSMALRGKCHGDCKLTGSSCSCVAVTFLTCANDESPFPLWCEQKFDVLDVKSKLRALDNMDATWKGNALRRIRVIHLSKLHQLLEYLLSIQSQRQRDRPRQCIIVDDLDRLCIPSGAVGDAASSSDSFRNIVQAVAVMSDTFDLLDKLGLGVHTIATMEPRIPTNVERVLSNWLPHSVTLEQMNNGDLMNELWTVQSVSPNLHSIQYKIVPRESGDCVVEWERRPE